MGKTKKLIEDFTQEELEQQLFQRANDIDFDYEEYRKSKQYVEDANKEFALHKPKYSDAEVDNAIKYAFDCIQLPPEEIGIDVYQKLFRQHFYEILNDGV
tara:strand:- start:416 stop:715 length:300 start_codon:yes stop_codon:yes gene_type:complete